VAISRAQLLAILEVIRRRVLGFTFDALGERALTDAELRTLKSLGIISAGTTSLTADPIALGRLIALVPLAARRPVTYEQVRRWAAQNIPTTEVELKAVEYAAEHAGTYIRGIGDMMVRDATAAGTRASGAALRAVRQNVVEAIAHRETISELKTRLFDAIDNRTRDWHRVAHTEINTAIQQGVHDAIVEASPAGGDQLVFKRPAPDACSHCKRLYLRADGVTPRVFRISELADSNVGLKAGDWRPVVGSTHPWCHCQLLPIPDGYAFVLHRVALERFDFKGKTYQRGEVVDDGEYARMGKDDQARVGRDAVLSYTGTTAEPEVEKSFTTVNVSDDCTCDH
jgi:hypothetical protein